LVGRKHRKIGVWKRKKTKLSLNSKLKSGKVTKFVGGKIRKDFEYKRERTL